MGKDNWAFDPGVIGVMYVFTSGLTFVGKDAVYRLYRQENALVLQRNGEEARAVLLPPNVNYSPSKKKWEELFALSGDCIRTVWPKEMADEVTVGIPWVAGLLSVVALVEWLEEDISGVQVVRGRGGTMVLYDGRPVLCVHQRESGDVVMFFDVLLLRQVVEQINRSGKQREYVAFAREYVRRVVTEILTVAQSLA